MAEMPDTMRPYDFHGVNMERRGKEAIADCPFCGREDKWTLNIEKGTWRCFGCNEGSEEKKDGTAGGNSYTFLRKLYNECIERADDADYDELGKDRSILYPVDSLSNWGVVKSYLCDEWLFPTWNAEDKLMSLYKYTMGAKGQANPDADANAWVAPVWDEPVPRDCKEIYLCEGPWDAIVLQELLERAKVVSPEGAQYELSITQNPDASLASDACVLAVPGANTFKDEWAPLFAGKIVWIGYDSDHPKEANGRTSPPAGWSAAERVTRLLTGSAFPPYEVRVFPWGPEGYASDVPSGYDARDFFTSARIPNAPYSL